MKMCAVKRRVGVASWPLSSFLVEKYVVKRSCNSPLTPAAPTHLRVSVSRGTESSCGYSSCDRQKIASNCPIAVPGGTYTLLFSSTGSLYIQHVGYVTACQSTFGAMYVFSSPCRGGYTCGRKPAGSAERACETPPTTTPEGSTIVRKPPIRSCGTPTSPSASSSSWTGSALFVACDKHQLTQTDVNLRQKNRGCTVYKRRVHSCRDGSAVASNCTRM